MPTIYDNYSDVMAMIGVEPVSYSYVSANYTTYSYIESKGFATESYVANYVDEHGGGEMPDMSSYVSKDELSEQAYISYVINRDIRPDATARWNFGSVDYVWDSTYQRNNYLGTKARIYGTNSYEIWVGFGTGTYYYVNRTRIQPNGTTQADLGSSNNNWQNTYTKKLYLNNTDIETRLSAYVSKTDLNGMSYASKSYVAEYVAEHGSSVDLSTYVSKDELSTQSYVSQSQLDNAGYITSIPSEYITENELSACGYLTEHQDISNLVSKTELSAQGYITSIPSEYITENELSACGYITMEDVSACGYITLNDIPSTDLSTYVSKTELSAQGYITSIPSEYITQAELSANGYLTSHQSLADYVTKTDLSNAGYITSIPSEYITQAELSANGYLTSHQSLADYPTYSYVSDNYLSLHGDRVMDGTLTLGNTVPAILGTERSWKIYEGGTGSGAYIALQNNVNNKSFFIRSESGQNLVQVVGNGSTASKHYLHSALQASYVNCYQYIKNVGNYNGSNGTPDVNDVASVWKASYSVSKLHYGTAVHDRTSYTVTATVDDFETDSNGNPLVGTTICVKLTSITGTNPSTLYPIKFIVNGKELPRWYANAAVTANGRNWYRDMNDGTNRYWYWFWDGSYWVWHGISDERDTTYSAMSDAEAAAGTSATARVIKPVTLATYYVAKSCFTFDSSTNTLTITTT